MDLRIADTFTDSLARLTGDEQKAVKTTAFDLQLNPASPGFSFHKLDAARDKNFWSVRVSSDIRLIVHRTPSSLLLCYVDHHDKAYQWASRRKLETHPKTGAAQFVKIRERVQEDLAPRWAAPAAAPMVAEPSPPWARAPKPALFADVADDDLLGYGVPPEWLADVRAADEDSLLTLAVHLPAEASEALLELATGGTPQVAAAPASGTSPFDHPDAQRRFRVMKDVEELQRALDAPWEKWAVFLHPAQRQWVERGYNGPARVSGSAGTGKTIVALHRAVFLARANPDARVLLATFSGALANALRSKMHLLVSHQPRLAERLEVHAMQAMGERLYALRCGPLRLATESVIQQAVTAALAAAKERGDVVVARFSPGFVTSEWRDVVDAWQLQDWPAYRDVKRLGRKTRMTEAQRAALWQVFDDVAQRLREAGVITPAAMFTRLAAMLAELPHPPFEHVVVDEAQDVSVSQLRCLAAMGATAGKVRPNSLFFAGDLGQRIFQLPFSWKALGVDVRGRSRTLHINYRTSHQIRRQADQLLGPEVSDVDGNVEDRRGTVSVFNGPAPDVRAFDSEAAEIAAVAEWLKQCAADGLAPHELAVFVRSDAQLPRALQAMKAAGLPHRTLDARVNTEFGEASVCTMHLAKGLEFRAVVVMACDDEVLPLQERMGAITDEADLEEIYNTERHLLYVACTRARDRLLVTSVEPASEFLDDLQGR
jgi:superfamily I DNA/RNA helicase/mRNA-degrading endonuclease RelE of RelBE toxin-antitoxin system